MDAETQTQINDLIELRETHKRRLRQLVLSAATTGNETNASVSVEIDLIRSKIVEIDSQIGKLHSKAAQWAARLLPTEPGAPAETPAETKAQLDAIGRYIFLLEDGVRHDLSSIYALIQIDQDKDKLERKAGQKHRKYIDYAIILLLIGVIIAVILS